MNLNLESVRKALRRAATEGLCNSGRSVINRRALVYYIGARKELLSNITSGKGSDPFPDSVPRTESSDSNQYGLSGKLGTDFEKNNFKNNSQVTSHFPSNDTQLSSNAYEEKNTELGKEVGKQLGYLEENCPSCTSEDIENQVSKDEVKDDDSTYLEILTPIRSMEEYMMHFQDKISVHPSFEENKNNSFKIQGITGKWNVKYELDSQHIHITYISPDAREGSQEEFIELTERLTLKEFREKVESAIWELERGLLCDRNFRVQGRFRVKGSSEMEPRWIEGCKLISVPNPPNSTIFLFSMPNGKNTHIFGLDEFELMEVDDE